MYNLSIFLEGKCNMDNENRVVVSPSPKWRIFIVTHGPIIDDYYKDDPLFNNENYVFFNVSDKIIKHDKFTVINKCEIPRYKSMGKWWAESEVIYNLYRMGLYEDFDYIGFMHYDFEFTTLKDGQKNITEILNKKVSENKDYISFFSHDMGNILQQYLILDERAPNTLFGKAGCGLHNCMEKIVDDYNLIFNKNVKLQDLLYKRANLCCSFLIKKDIFEKLASLLYVIMNSGYLDKFDVLHKYRLHGQITERYVSLFSTQYNIDEMTLKHNFIGGRAHEGINSYTV